MLLNSLFLLYRYKVTALHSNTMHLLTINFTKIQIELKITIMHSSVVIVFKVNDFYIINSLINRKSTLKSINYVYISLIKKTLIRPAKSNLNFILVPM